MQNSVYNLMKRNFCNEYICKYNGECEKCEFGEIREQAARDYDEIKRLRKLVNQH